MFKSLKIGWEATNIGERIETSTGYIIDSLILEGVHIKTHDTIFIFSQIYSMVTHNMYGKLLIEKGQRFINELDVRLKFDEKKWLTKVLQIPMDITSVSSIDVFFEKELDEFRDKWLQEYMNSRKEDPNAMAGTYTHRCISLYIMKKFPIESATMNGVNQILESHLDTLDELTKH